MATNALAVQSQGTVMSIAGIRANVVAMRAQRTAIVELLRESMVKDVDYGIVPGTDKPSLLKPGSEKILAMLHLGVRPRVEDLSTPDCIRYRVHVEIFHQGTNISLGEGVGEASSAESKYQWRAVVCDEEWNETPEDRRRIKWKKADKYHSKPYSIRQVRAEMEDVSNTILKMGKKRSQIDATLTCTAASDIFSQDLEELIKAGLDLDETGENGPPKADPLPQNLQPKQQPPAQQQQTQPAPQTQAPAPAQQQTAPANHGETISEPEGKAFWAKAINRTNDYKAIMEYLKSVHGVTKKDFILRARFKDAMVWAESGRVD